MRRRWLRWLVLLLLLGVGGAAWWLLASEAGLVWAWGRAAVMLEGRLTAERVSGRLLGPLRAEGVRLEQDGMRLDVVTMALDWQPGWLLGGRLALRGVTAQGVRLQLVAPGAAGGTAAPALPVPLSVEGAVLRDLSLLRAGAEPLLIDEVRLNGGWHGTRLSLAPLVARGSWGQVSLEGRLAAGPGQKSDLAAKWALTLDPLRVGLQSDHPLPVAGEGRVSGTYYEPELTVRLNAPFALDVKGTLAWQVSPPRWQAEFDLPPLAVATLHPGWPEWKVAARGRLAGEGTEFSVEAGGEAAEARIGSWAFSGRAAYGAAGAQLLRLAVQPRQGSGEVVLQGNWVAGGVTSELSAQWDGFGHPLLPGWRSSGSLSATGLPEDYRGRLDLDAARDGLPPLEVSTDFAGNLQSVTLSALAGRWLGGAWGGEAVLGWHDGFDWRGLLRAADVDPGQLDARWPGQLAGEAESSGRWHDGHLSVALPRFELEGTLANRPLRLEGASRLEDRQLSIERLELRSGAARLSASGGAGAAWSLRWQLAAESLADLWPDAAGQLNLRGRVDGPEREPRLRLEGEGKALAWAGIALAQAGLSADVDLAGTAPWMLDAQLDGLARGAPRVESARLRAHGSAAQHDITLEARFADGGSANIEARGRWADRRWAGELHRGRLALPQLGIWQAPAAALDWGLRRGVLQAWCWRGRGEVCLAGAMTEGQWQVTGALAGMPLALLEPWLPRSDLAMSGDVGGVATAMGEAGVMHALTARLAVADGRLLYRLPDGAVESALRTLRLDVDGDAEGLRAQWQAEAVDGGSAQARLALPGWLPGLPLSDTQPVQGHLEVEADRLEWLTYLEPHLLRPEGQLRVQLQLSGTLAAPALNGALALREGSVRLPAAGIHLTGLSLDGRSSDGQTLTLSGKASSGPGQLAITGRLASERFGQWRAEVTLKGERFELMRRVQARALVSPDLTVVLEPGRMAVSGQLEVPLADINLPRLPTVVEVSPDEVILDAVEDAAALRRWRLLLDLRLVAGERVRLEGYGFSGRLAGALSLRGEMPGLTRAQGELNIHDGRYEAYGQNLVVEHGRLLFADSPPDNPGLDVRAVRPLSDADQVVGVEVSGRLKDPRLRLFSVPLLEESDALAWLVLGRPLAATSRIEADALYRAAFALGGERAARGIALQFGLDEVSVEQGSSGDEAALVLGKYLSPRLYLQYAVGLWDTANRLRLRYQLSSHWSLKMEQGGDQSGADLQYVIER